ncbi:beta-galactosidase (plasmid) [Hymenobacter sp. NBH84]|uniref:glycoside hydrolase family 2 protein n=1 Tax=Hymenobacter sp. NBH84 TaxID=2596915 RepID=UPI0016238D77|nr:sugar-binding domain-containing protein [Hymenobacter sp. NBH84]QNE41966.1 beta-galactosidase [Hymenobacter sp. NBH84]
MQPSKILLLLLLLLIALCAAPAFAQRDTIALNSGWQFAVDKKAEGRQGQWYARPLAQARAVQLPHTWNVEPNNQRHYGWGWYQKNLAAPASWKSKSVVLEFGAVNHTAYVYLNGEQVGENIGDGFDKFYVDLTGKLKAGQQNTLTVAVNNDYGRNKVPYGSSFDWPNDGGIIRPVALIVTGRPAVRYLHAAPKLDVRTGSGTLEVRLGLAEAAARNLSFAVTITEENQATKKVILKKTGKAIWKKGEAVLSYSLPQVKPWHFDFPNLYRIDVAVLSGRKAVDKISANTGFREVKFEGGKTYLNGERMKLMGVEWTAGSNPDYGFAEPAAEIRRQGKLMKDVNAIFTRQHFQQSDVFYDFCDRNGILVQQEVPLWGPETPSNDTIRTIAMRQLETMVRNMYNYPSIFSWGAGNELRGRNAHMKQMITDLVARARELDPSRHVAYVSNTLTQGFYNKPNFTPDAGSLGDYLMMNEYGGSWWAIPVGQIHSYLDSVHLSYPDKPLFISEFGLVEPNFRGGDERRIQDLVYHMAIYESKPYIEGAIYFDLTDYRTHYPGTSEKNKYRRRVHGIYDMYGKPKPSMQVLREMSSPLEVQQLRQQGKKGKASLLIFGSVGLPQHLVKGYKVYLSSKTDNWQGAKAYELPDIKPGQKLDFEIDDEFDGAGIITVVRPTGYVASQKSFYANSPELQPMGQ